MQSLKTNILANLAGRIWSAALTLILIPFYIRFLGIEAYGLIGFYTMLLASLAVLDLGLSTTMNRELARARATGKKAQEVQNLVFTLECIYWVLGFVFAAAIVLFAPLIATQWIHAETLPSSTVVDAIRLMGIVVAFQWPISIYSGGLLGLEKQVLYNVIMIIMSTLRAAGVLLLFLFVEPSLPFFFFWQAALSILYVLTMRSSLWRQLPATENSRQFSKKELKNIWRFATGMTGVGITAFLLAQVDKIVLSKLLPLSQYGYYTLSVTLTASLGTVISPVYMAAFPRLSGLISRQEEQQVRSLYHVCSKLVASLTFAIGLFILFFAPEVLWAWTKNAQTVEQTTLLVRVLVIAYMCSALASVPAVLLQAHGNTRFILRQNLLAVVVLIPLLFIWTKNFGTVGATFVMLSLYTGYILIGVPLIHHRYLKGDVKRWYIDDLFLPLLPPLAFLTFCKWLQYTCYAASEVPLLLLSILGAFTLAISLMANPAIRHWVIQLWLAKGKKPVGSA